jgi:hypothetical protein
MAPEEKLKTAAARNINCRALQNFVAPEYPFKFCILQDPERREAFLSTAEFYTVFKMTYSEFGALPSWRKQILKRDAMML